MRTVDCRFRLIDGVPVRLQKEKGGFVMVGKATKEATLSVLGMKCEHCAANLENALLKADGIEKAKVKFCNKNRPGCL